MSANTGSMSRFDQIWDSVKSVSEYRRIRVKKYFKDFCLRLKRKAGSTDKVFFSAFYDFIIPVDFYRCKIFSLICTIMLDFIAQMFDIFINGFYGISFSCIEGANYLHKNPFLFLVGVP